VIEKLKIRGMPAQPATMKRKRWSEEGREGEPSAKKKNPGEKVFKQ